MAMDQNGIFFEFYGGKGGSAIGFYHAFKGEVMHSFSFHIISIVVMSVEIELHVGVVIDQGDELGAVP